MAASIRATLQEVSGESLSGLAADFLQGRAD